MDYQLSKIKFNALPDDLKKEVMDFIDFLLKKHMPSKTDQQFDFNWEGGLASVKDKFQSVDLQHQSLEWR
jgi:hypothetical protein